jgi:hypothetical protein
MMPQTVPNRPMYGDRADRGEEGEVRFERVHLALVGGAHGAARAVDDVLGVEVLLAAQLGEFAETGFEDALHANRRVAVVDRAVEQVVEVAAGPEIALEVFRLAHVPA